MKDFWQGKKVLITGHTGFKGSWLSFWLQRLGANLIGYALEPPTNPSLFELAGVGEGMISIEGDVRDYEGLKNAIEVYQPEIIFHMAAQSLVGKSYHDPLGTIETNVMGTANLLNAVRHVNSVRLVIIVTSDKCYDNREWIWGYRENDKLGGLDPYSGSKGCAEIITAAYRHSYFNLSEPNNNKVAIASVRAGNVIGGGDWAEDRLIPDIMRSVMNSRPVQIRNPNSIRPWQHVLDPLNGYLILAEQMWDNRIDFSEAWNFGPSDSDTVPVSDLTQRITRYWGDGAEWVFDQGVHPHEAYVLKLECSKARSKLKWKPVLNIENTVEWVVKWYKAYASGLDVRSLTVKQIDMFEQLKREIL